MERDNSLPKQINHIYQCATNEVGAHMIYDIIYFGKSILLLQFSYMASSCQSDMDR